MRFVLDADRSPVPVAEHPPGFWDDPGRLVGRSELGPGVVLVTEFTGTVKSLRGDLPPLLFESRLEAAGKPAERLERYRTWPEAEAGHARFAARLGQATQASGRVV